MLADFLQMTEEALKLRASHNRVTVGLGARLWGRDESVALDSGSHWCRELCAHRSLPRGS